MWFIGVEVEQETSPPPPNKNPGSAPDNELACVFTAHFGGGEIHNREEGEIARKSREEGEIGAKM